VLWTFSKRNAVPFADDYFTLMPQFDVHRDTGRHRHTLALVVIVQAFLYDDYRRRVLVPPGSCWRISAPNRFQVSERRWLRRFNQVKRWRLAK
jgi:hypothetical protein